MLKILKRLRCFLTGGHKYAHKNIETHTHPYDSRWVLLSDKCIKCGKLYCVAVNVDCQIKHDLIPMGIDFKKGGVEE